MLMFLSNGILYLKIIKILKDDKRDKFSILLYFIIIQRAFVNHYIVMIFITKLILLAIFL